VVSVLAIGPKGCRLKPSRGGGRVLNGDKKNLLGHLEKDCMIIVVFNFAKLTIITTFFVCQMCDINSLWDNMP
jgi:hypothetical protein